jgi:carboxyl-terminal processing protease
MQSMQHFVLSGARRRSEVVLPSGFARSTRGPSLRERLAQATGNVVWGWWLVALLLTGAMLTGTAQAQADGDAPLDDYELMRIFVDTFQEIDKNYVREVDRRRLIEAAVRGMLSELDEYSDYISPDHLEHFTETISQEFGGVGIRVRLDRQDRTIEVMTPLPGSPAYEAGIQAGDHIIEIDGRPVKDFPVDGELNEAVKMLRGKPGESVEMVIRRGDSQATENVTLTRDVIQLDTVMGYTYNEQGEWDFMLDEERKIGYLRLTHFTKRSASEIRQALRDLKKQGMQALVLDLRFNPGGLLQAAVDISDLFIEEGVIVSTDGRSTQPRKWAAKSFGTFTDFPMAVLINRYSASASEIVSACLQDHGRAVVVGERSWGKGSVQNVIDLEEGKSALKLTTASYHRPSGKKIHRFPDAKESDEWGVMPDEGFEIRFSREELRDYQRDRQERDTLGRKEKYESDYVDKQLEKAVLYLRDQLAPPDTQAAEEDAPKKADEKPQEDKDKDAARLPLIPVPKDNAA